MGEQPAVESGRRLVQTRQRGWIDPARVGFDYRCHTCADELSPFAEHFWIVTWDLAEPFTQKLISHPVVNLTVTEAFARVAGVISGEFSCTQEGRGRVVGLRFRPGGFRPFMDGPVSSLTGRFVSLPDLYGTAGATLWRKVLAAPEEEAMRLIERFLLDLDPAPDPLIDEAAALVSAAETDRTITRVDQLAAAAGTSVRSLQRLFQEYVGIGPKWVIRRFRLHEAAERVLAGLDLSDLAAELGYTDQAHLTRDFAAVVGLPPAAYHRLASA
ncbi:helix-turn-helix domain-containing protein [Nonomuraea sp. SYSU D8015]|uniref:helix-turn-helix domain-containing protein n=1 Tax=Nonomuraea sp. SYSU D8015 TaxID=2593644 RepID=UPI00166013E1|nr:helix-turn-helix domain-containing protein [Nonomuraea sp. SYSU D8015]